MEKDFILEMLNISCVSLDLRFQSKIICKLLSTNIVDTSVAVSSYFHVIAMLLRVLQKDMGILVREKLGMIWQCPLRKPNVS